MSRETTAIERVQTVLLALAVVAFTAGGVVAVTGGTVADGSLTDTSGTDADGSVPDADAPNGTDDAEGDSDETIDDGAVVGDGDDNTTEEVENTTSTDTVDDAASTEDVENVTSTDAVDGDAESPDSIELEGVDGTLSLEGASTGSSSDGSTDAAAGASPDSVGVTAGATNQPPIETAGAGPATLNFTEHAPGEFPTNGTARLTLPTGTGVALDTENTSAVVSGDGATATVTDVTATEVTIAVTSTDAGTNSSLRLDGLRFTAGADANASDATWTFGNASGTTTVEPERLRVTGFENDVPRGAYHVPGDEASVAIDAPEDARTEGFHAQDDLLGVKIPEEYDGDIEFDTSADIQVTSESGDCGYPIISDPMEETYFLTEDEIVIDLSCEIGTEEYVYAKGIRFNVSGAGVADPAEMDVQLVANYKPVDRIEPVNVDAGGQVSAHAPEPSVNTTTVEANATNTSGDGGVRLSLRDDIGGLMGDGSRMTVELAGTGVTFNESQTFEAVAVAGDSPAPTVVSANATTVVLEVDGPTQQGDEFRAQRVGGEPIRFDTTPGANDTALRVTTTPGDEDVTQVTGTVVEVTEEQTCRSYVDVLTDDAGEVPIQNMSYTYDLWKSGDPVPGTCGETLSAPQTSYIADIWKDNQEYEP